MTITPVPKPQPRTEAERRATRIASVKKLRASQKPIPRSSLKHQQEKKQFKPKRPVMIRRSAVKKKNEKRQQRQAVIRRQKHSAYRRSECYKAVEARAQGRCERVHVTPTSREYSTNWVARCPNKRSDGLKMVHNHLTYARYGGKELPEDMELLCPSCNAAYESQKRGNRPFPRAGGGSQ